MRQMINKTVQREEPNVLGVPIRGSKINLAYDKEK